MCPLTKNSHSLTAHKNTNINIQYDVCQYKVQIDIQCCFFGYRLLILFSLALLNRHCGDFIQMLKNWIFTFVLN